MWFLQNQLHAAIRVSLPIEKDLLIGRKDCDIVIQNDSSVSRRHAIIRVGGNTKTATVELTDVKAKFGTAVNRDALSAQGKILLHHNDEIKFGQAPGTGSFRLVFEPLQFCCSSVSSSGKAKVKQLVKKLGGQLVDSWTLECSYLVMTGLTVTIKVVSALAHCKPIIVPAWMEEAVKCLAARKPLPSTSCYLPPLSDGNLGSVDISFHPDYKRRKLFSDKVVYFLSEKQYFNLRLCVSAAGAKCELINFPNSVHLDTLLDEEAIVLSTVSMPTLPQDMVSWATDVQQFLESNQLRCVQESEVGFALLHVSTEIYFNPSHPQDLEVAAAPLPPPSLSQMPYALDISSQAATASTRVFSPPHNALANKGSADEVFEEPVETGVYGDADFFLPPRVPKCLQTVKPHSNAIVSTGGTSTNCSTSHSVAEVKSKALISSDAVSSSSCLSGGAESAISEDVSVLAPSSLTPSAHNASCRQTTRKKSSTGNESALPSHCLMAELFRGKRSKQGVSSSPLPSAINELEEKDRPAKRQRMESDTGTDLSRADQSSQSSQIKGDLFGNITCGGTRRKVASGKHLKQFTPVEMEKAAGISDRDESDSKFVGISISTPIRHLDLVQSKNNSASDILGGKHGSGSRKTSDSLRNIMQENTSSSPSSDYALETKISLDPVSNMPQSTTVATPKRRPVGIAKSSNSGNKTNSDGTGRNGEPVTNTPTKEHFTTPTSFLSSRKTKQSHHPPLCQDASQISIYGTQSSSAVDSSSSGPFTALSLGRPKEVVVPLTAVSTGGRRSKVTPSRANVDSFLGTKDTDELGENLLGGAHEGEEVFSCKSFQPVCDADGFIKTRIPPRLKLSRMARLALRARLDFDSSVGSELCGPLLSQPVAVQVENLVLAKGTRGGGRKEKGRGEGRVEEAVENRTISNFKRFKKTCHGRDGRDHVVRHAISLTMYVPVVSHELPDWDVEVAGEEDDVGGGNTNTLIPRWSGGSQDFNVFSLGTKKSRRI